MRSFSKPVERVLNLAVTESIGRRCKSVNNRGVNLVIVPVEEPSCFKFQAEPAQLQ